MRDFLRRVTAGPLPEQPYRWSALATYNSERARGIVHTPAWDMFMAREQAAFDAEQRFKYGDDPFVHRDPLSEPWGDV